MTMDFGATEVRVAAAFLTGLVVGGTSLYLLRRPAPPAAAPAAAAAPASARDMALILNAAAYAAVAHRDQRRKNETGAPYIEHPLGVAALLAEAGFTHPPTLAAAMLHDTVEDTAVSPEELVAVFGPEVGTCFRSIFFRGGRGGVGWGVCTACRNPVVVLCACVCVRAADSPWPPPLGVTLGGTVVDAC